MFRSRWFFYLNIFVLILFIFCGVSAFIAYSSIPSIKNIRGCFTTSLYKVSLCPKNANYVRYNQLPVHLIYSLVVSEDASFYTHNGFDWHEIQESLRQNLDAGHWVRGGSTITQQLAKNLYLDKEKSLIRKFKEFFIAYKIEEELSKKEILEKYFNVVEFGPKIYGIAKASQYYFNKYPSQLNPEESAYLISILPSPTKYSSAFRRDKTLSSFNRSRIKTILIRLKARNKITEEDEQMALSRMDYGLWAPKEEPSFWQQLWNNSSNQMEQTEPVVNEVPDSQQQVEPDNESEDSQQDLENKEE